jgi:putative ABC transport system ATP-binding protein
VSAVRLFDVSKVRGAGRHAVQALHAVTLAVQPGEFVLLEGPSGSGKTTLLSIAAGLLTPDAGDVTLADQSLNKLSAAQRRSYRARNVGFVFQRGNLLSGLNVRENVLVAAEIAGIPRQVGEEDADKLLAALGVDHLAERRPDELSGGEEHRVAVARALVHQPAVVFADEPTGNLDGASGQAVAEALSELTKADAVAVIVATHDVRLRKFADRRVSIVDGTVHPTES